jgi:NADH-ubiquinone oxidoreductase chain 3
MFILFILVIFTFLLVSILKLVSLLISETVILRREELTSYECGFEHHSLSRVPFSFRYFFLTLIFLLFDLEIILLLFFPFAVVFSSSYLTVFITVLFILFLFIGLIYE